MIKNEVTCGHIVFVTTVSGAEPLPEAGAYNATVRRQTDKLNNPIPGGYIVTVGKAMAPPAHQDMDIDISSTPLAGPLWTSFNVANMGVNSNGDREYALNGTEEVAGGASIRVCDSAGVVVRFTVKRVNPRAT